MRLSCSILSCSVILVRAISHPVFTFLQFWNIFLPAKISRHGTLSDTWLFYIFFHGFARSAFFYVWDVILLVQKNGYGSETLPSIFHYTHSSSFISPVILSFRLVPWEFFAVVFEMTTDSSGWCDRTFLETPPIYLKTFKSRVSMLKTCKNGCLSHRIGSNSSTALPPERLPEGSLFCPESGGDILDLLSDATSPQKPSTRSAIHRYRLHDSKHSQPEHHSCSSPKSFTRAGSSSAEMSRHSRRSC